MTLNDYCIFQKSIKSKDGKKITKKWVYSFYDFTGRRVQRVCKDCRTKAEAVAFVNSLPPIAKNHITIRTIAENMFVRGSDHLKRREAMGRKLDEKTLYDYRQKILIILEKWGEMRLEEFEIRDAARFLLQDSRGSSWKKTFVRVLEEIYAESLWYGVKVEKPIMPHFVAKNRKKDVFLTDELQRFFKRENFAALSIDLDAETAFLFFYVTFCGGLRIGETRALRPKQFLWERSALIIDGFCKRNGERTNFNKKGSENDPRTRIVFLPSELAAEIRAYAEKKGRNGEDFLFQFNSRPIRGEFIETLFKKILARSGIEVGERIFSPHSLRYTYVTRMRRTVAGDVVQKLVGHSSLEMTDYYTKITLDDGLAAVASSKDAVEHLFD